MAHRTVVEGDWFDASRKVLELSARRLDEILEGAMLVLPERPTYFPKVPGTILHTLRTEEVAPDIPSYTIYFTFNMHKVTLEWIERTDPDD